jgi:hypothetical protein
VNKFIFEKYYFDTASHTAHFHYGFEDGQKFEEKVMFQHATNYNPELLERALFLSFMLIGTSYYKCFPSTEVILKVGGLDTWQVNFFNRVYQEGLSQFAFENNLKRANLAHFEVSNQVHIEPLDYEGSGIIALQSGGKDSLLTATLLQENRTEFTPWYVSSSETHPEVLDKLGAPLKIVRRQLDLLALKQAARDGALNGHVPVTYIVSSLAIIEAILSGKSTILLSVGHEGEEPHAMLGDLPVNHQWSKTWPAEQALNEYIQKYISPRLKVGSGLRAYSELKIAELFASHTWAKYSHKFSSCNRANYQQGADNATLKWCGDCPKCANSFLLFAPFVEPRELKSLFDDQDLFAKPSLMQTYKGLLGIDNVMKPLECVGEIDELRLAYHLARKKWESGYAKLPFVVPESGFDYQETYDAQTWAQKLLFED